MKKRLFIVTNMSRQTVLLTIIVIFLLSPVYGQSTCDCVEVFQCESARKSIMMFGSHSLKRCGWKGLIEKICCPDKTAAVRESSTTPDELDGNIWIDNEDGTKSSTSRLPGSSTVSSSTAKPNEPRGTARKSETACTRYATNVNTEIAKKIVGGEDAETGEFPHMVALGYTNPDAEEGDTQLMWICAGSLISDRYVVTAAHCVIRIRPLKALVGILRISETSDTRNEYDISNITLHPQYVRRTGSNDIALLRMSSVVTFNDNVYPACLYSRSDDPLGLIITGWGKVALGQDARSDVLQKALVVPVSISSCNETYLSRLNRALSTRQICAGPANPERPTDSCPGDSGGPLQIFMQTQVYAVVGVISFGITDCGGDTPSVYTRVYEYTDWIEGIVWP